MQTPYFWLKEKFIAAMRFLRIIPPPEEKKGREIALHRGKAEYLVPRHVRSSMPVSRQSTAPTLLRDTKSDVAELQLPKPRYLRQGTVVPFSQSYIVDKQKALGGNFIRNDGSTVGGVCHALAVLLGMSGLDHEFILQLVDDQRNTFRPIGGNNGINIKKPCYKALDVVVGEQEKILSFATEDKAIEMIRELSKDRELTQTLVDELRKIDKNYNPENNADLIMTPYLIIYHGLHKKLLSEYFTDISVAPKERYEPKISDTSKPLIPDGADNRYVALFKTNKTVTREVGVRIDRNVCNRMLDAMETGEFYLVSDSGLLGFHSRAIWKVSDGAGNVQFGCFCPNLGVKVTDDRVEIADFLEQSTRVEGMYDTYDMVRVTKVADIVRSNPVLTDLVKQRLTPPQQRETGINAG